MHSKIEKLYLLSAVELIPLTCDYLYIMSVSLTVPGRINYYSIFKLYWVLQPLFYIDMATVNHYPVKVL